MNKPPSATQPTPRPSPAPAAAPSGPRRRVGILTLQNQLNYGGVLQAFALQRVLLGEGFDAELIDYWHSPNNALLYGDYLDPAKPKVKRALRAARHILKRGAFFVRMDIARRRRTLRFLSDQVASSARAYRSADELAEIAGYDALVVGSDQVWNYQWHGRPNPFLLSQADPAVRRISYAASFGFTALPADYLDDYRKGLNAFDSISVREKEGVDLIRAWTGRDAEWVLDPTLLLPEAEWRPLLGGNNTPAPFIFCYWLGDLSACLDMLRALPRPNGENVRLFIPLQQLYGRRKAGDWLLRMRLLSLPYVRLCCGAGPLEYLRDVACATAVASDSFHALMFACIFRKPVKIFINTSRQRAGMAARMMDFVSRYGIADALSYEVPGQPFAFARPDYGALGAEIEADRRRSLDFLRRSLSLRASP